MMNMHSKETTLERADLTLSSPVDVRNCGKGEEMFIFFFLSNF